MHNAVLLFTTLAAAHMNVHVEWRQVLMPKLKRCRSIKPPTHLISLHMAPQVMGNELLSGLLRADVEAPFPEWKAPEIRTPDGHKCETGTP